MMKFFIAILLLGSYFAEDCPRPSSGCYMSWDDYKTQDCDGDGVLDHVCQNTNDGRIWVALSTASCQWVQTDSSACPAAFENGQIHCSRPSSGCYMSWDDYKTVDCDGDGVLDHACENTNDGRIWVAFSTGSCQWVETDSSACPAAFEDEIYAGNEAVYRATSDSGPDTDLQVVSEYEISASGTLVAWEVYSNKVVSNAYLQVFRRTGVPYTYDLVGATNEVSLVDGYKKIEASIEVQSGDVLGWYVPGVQSIVFDHGGDSIRMAEDYIGDEASVDMSAHQGWSRTYSIRATIQTNNRRMLTGALGSVPNEVNTAEENSDNRPRRLLTDQSKQRKL